MLKIIASTLLILVIPATVFAIMQSPNYRIDYEAITPGGQIESSTNYKMLEALDETGEGKAKSGSYQIGGGLNYGIQADQPGTPTLLNTGSYNSLNFRINRGYELSDTDPSLMAHYKFNTDPLIDSYTTTGVASETIGATNTKISQKFQAGSATRISAIDIYQTTGGTLVGDIRIETDSQGSPSGSLVYAGAKADDKTLNAGSATHIPLNAISVITAGMEYWIVFSTDSGSGTFQGNTAGTADQAKYYDGADWNYSAIVESLYFKVQNQVDDSSDTGNNGKVIGAITADGRFGKALQFDGTDDYVEVADDTSLDITSAITIEAWVYDPPGAIDIGSAAINRETLSSPTLTYFDLNNPANLSGTITNIEIWAVTNMTGMRVGTFFLVSGTTYQVRDSETIGAVTAGSKQTFPVSIAVQAGDFIGCYFATGEIERTSLSGDGYAYTTGEYIDPGDQTSYASTAPRAISLYGTGGPRVIVGKGSDAYQLEIDNNLNVSGYIKSQAVTAQITKAWHHLALTYDGATQKLYVDGVLKTSAALSGAIGTNANNLKIGELVPGKIDEIGIYNRAKTAYEISRDAQIDNPEDAEYAIAISDDNWTTTSYLQASNTLGNTMAWQNYTNWGSGTGETVTGLEQETEYKMEIKARHGDFTETGWSSETSAITSPLALSFSIDKTWIDLGTLVPNQVSSGSHLLTVSTNGESGYVTTVQEDENLRLGDGLSDIDDVTDGQVSMGEEYGVRTSGSAEGQMSDQDYAITSIPQTIASSTGPVNPSVATVTYKAVVDPNAPAGKYSHTVTYICTTTF